jgi:phage repressor protein C with HTH and peptisase S24 domain
MNPWLQWIEDALAANPKKSKSGLAKALGRTPAAVTRLLRYGRELKAREIRLIAEYLETEPPVADDIPLVSFTTAGALAEVETIESDNDIEGYIPNPGLGPGRWIALRVEGESMDRIAPNGSIIFVNRNDKVLFNGGYFVVRYQSETTFKRFLADDKSPPRLVPFSTQTGFNDIFPNADFYVVGRVEKVVMSL